MLMAPVPSGAITGTGNLHSDYERVGLLGFPACSSIQCSMVVKKLEEFVSDLAEWSCS